MIGAYSSEAEEMRPPHLLPILGLATGRPVGASWIEFRDQNGHLVYRIHRDLGRSTYGRGREVVHDMTHKSGLRRLLNEASKSGVISNPLIHTALRDAAEAISGHNLTIIFYYTFTALDLLFKYYPVVEENVKTLKKQLITHPQVITDIEQILKIAMAEINKLITKHSIVDQNQVDLIGKVAGNARSIPLGKRSEFGDMVVELIRLLGFSDIEVLSNSKYYTNINVWSEKVRDYRNDTMHTSHYKKISDPERLKDFERFMPHLIDILVRVLLKTVGYTGNYAPVVMPPGTSQEVNWVNPSTPASSLGYK